MKKIKKALISVSNKNNLSFILKILKKYNIQLISSGGTYKEIKKLGFNCIEISKYTGSKEILGGRVKTLHPKIHAGILSVRNNKSHIKDLVRNNFEEIDLVIVNFYPFEKTLKDTNNHKKIIENIDIGGPALVRAAAKNYNDVTVLTDLNQYYELANELKSNNGNTSMNFRQKMAEQAFTETAYYDSIITNYLNFKTKNIFPKKKIFYGNIVEKLRYGENPHQDAGIYVETLGSGGIAGSEQLHGLPMSYTNFLDADGAWTTVNGFTENACVIVKHTNPCGISVHPDQAMAYQKAFEGDSVSAYGGIVGFNRNVTASTANAMKGVLFDIIVAPSFDDEALGILKRRKRTRVLRAEKAVGPLSDIGIKTISGGALIQTLDTITEKPDDWKVVTERIPTEREWADLVFSWKCLRYIKSNTIVLAKDNTLVGMGAGQPNRVVSVHLALRIAGAKAVGSALASDAFMPFADNIEMAAEGGVIAVAQPGGSIRDDDVIEAANKANIAMVFTGIRHFNH